MKGLCLGVFCMWEVGLWSQFVFFLVTSRGGWVICVINYRCTPCCYVSWASVFRKVVVFHNMCGFDELLNSPVTGHCISIVRMQGSIHCVLLCQVSLRHVKRYYVQVVSTVHEHVRSLKPYYAVHRALMLSVFHGAQVEVFFSKQRNRIHEAPPSFWKWLL